MNDKISEAFGIESMDEQQEITSLVTKELEKIPEDDSDYEYARTNIKKLIELGYGALKEVIYLAKSTEHPKVYEQISTLLKTIGDQNISLIDMQQKVKGNLKKSEEVKSNYTQNIFFEGTTADLMKKLKGDKNV